MPQAQRAPVQFTNPPVIEVVCGVSFSLPTPLKTAHVGRYWSQVTDEFPRCDDAQPLAFVVEGPLGFDPDGIQIEQSILPPLRRSWLISDDGTNLVQIQEDRFLFNWKSGDHGAPYPGYTNVIAAFQKQWTRYRDFLRSDVSEPSMSQLEMTYWNFLVGGWELLRDHGRDTSDGERFLPEPELINWRCSFGLPEGAGRLHVVAASARHNPTGRRGVRLELTARGMPKDVSDESCAAWFAVAHEWITQGFADMTTPNAHRDWGRTA